MRYSTSSVSTASQSFATDTIISVAFPNTPAAGTASGTAAASAAAAAAAAADADAKRRLTYTEVYNAVRERMRGFYKEKFEEAGVTFKGASIDLLERLLAVGEEA